MFEDRRDIAEAEEDGGGRDEEYEINSMGGTIGHRERRCPAEKRRERW